MEKRAARDRNYLHARLDEKPIGNIRRDRLHPDAQGLDINRAPDPIPGPCRATLKSENGVVLTLAAAKAKRTPILWEGPPKGLRPA